jgi:hypothetical protein
MISPGDMIKRLAKNIGSDRLTLREEGIVVGYWVTCDCGNSTGHLSIYQVWELKQLYDQKCRRQNNG